jgi:hypothetical protein
MRRPWVENARILAYLTSLLDTAKLLTTADIVTIAVFGVGKSCAKIEGAES